MTFNGYKSYINNATGTQVGIKSVDYNPRGGDFLVESTNPFDTVQNTTIVPSSNNSTSCVTNVTTTVTSVPTHFQTDNSGYSTGTLAGSIVGAAIGGLLLG